MTDETINLEDFNLSAGEFITFCEHLAEASRQLPSDPLFEATLEWASLPWWRRMFTPRPAESLGLRPPESMLSRLGV